MEEIIEKFNESWDNRGDIGLTKAEFHAYIQMSYYKGWKDAMEKMQDEMNKFTSGFAYKKVK